MNGVDQALKDAMAVDGALGAALVDVESGTALGARTTLPTLNPVLAAAGHTDIVRATEQALAATGLDTETIEDILTSLTAQYHLIRPLRRGNGSRLFLSLSPSLSLDRANLAMARHHLHHIEAGLDV